MDRVKEDTGLHTSKAAGCVVETQGSRPKKSKFDAIFLDDPRKGAEALNKSGLFKKYNLDVDEVLRAALTPEAFEQMHKRWDTGC